MLGIPDHEKFWSSPNRGFQHFSKLRRRNISSDHRDYIIIILVANGHLKDFGKKHLSLVKPGVNFISMLMCSFYCANAMAFNFYLIICLHSTSFIALILKYAQLLCCTLYAVRQKEQRKSAGAKAAHKMLIKLTPVATSVFTNHCNAFNMQNHTI